MGRVRTGSVHVGREAPHERHAVELSVGDPSVAGSATAWTLLLATLVIVVAGAAVSANSDHADRAEPRSQVPVAASPVSPVTTTTLVPPGACRVSVTGSFVALHDRPSRTSRTLLAVPRGDYVVAGSRSLIEGTAQHWLLIDVDGISGWVRDVADHLELNAAACA